MSQAEARSYPQLDHLIHAYLNQDYEISGSTIEEVVNAYKQDREEKDRSRLLDDMQQFKRAYSSRLDEAFLESYGFDFDPGLWDLNTAEFFDLVKRTLSQSG
jgi:hypothetical protein